MMLERLAARPVAVAVAGACAIAFSAVFVRLSGAAPATAAVFRCLYALPFLVLLTAVERRRLGPLPARARRLALFAGICFAADLVLWHLAIEAVGAGLATVLGNLQVLVVALAAWALLGERPARTLAVAIPVVLVGVLLLSGVVGQGAYGEDPVLGVVFGALTSLAYSGFILLLRQGADDPRRVAGPLLYATAVAAVGSALAGVALGRLDLVPRWPGHGWLALLALSSQVIGWLLISVSLPRLPAAVTSLVLLVQPVGAVGLGVVLLGERPSAVQLIGVVVVLGGVLIGTRRRRATPAPDPPAAADAALSPGRPGP
jgi:drug/metabolite transporter (DMT)-like permease